MSSSCPQSVDKGEFPLYYPELFMHAVRCASNFTGNDLSSAEDIAQEILITIYIALKNGKKIDNIKGYIYQSTRHMYLTKLKKAAVRKIREENWTAVHYTTNSEDTVINFDSVTGKDVAGNILNEHSNIGRQLKLFMNDKEFQVLKFEFSDKRKTYEHIEQAIEKEAELIGLTADNYYQCKNRSILKLKVFLFRVRPELLGGLKNIRRKLTSLKDEVATSPPLDVDAIERICQIMALHSKRYENELNLLKTTSRLNQQTKVAYAQVLAAILKDPSWTKEEIKQFRRWDKELNEKIIPEDIHLFESVVFGKKSVPHGRKNDMDKVCNILMGSFSVSDLLDSG